MVIAAGEYARQVLYEPLGIRGWELRWQNHPPDDENAFAQVLPIEGRRLASVYLCNDFAERDPVDIHMVLIHELIHLIHRDQTDTFRLGGHQAGMAQAAYDVLHECLRIQTELMVDHLTDCFVRLIPINEPLMSIITGQGKKKKG